MATAVAAARRRIIRRPRLTSMLDESTARIRMLIAPAGYGKTTLAREWLGEDERRDVWYRGGPASADVAALGAGIAEAVGEIVPDAGKRMRERVRATGHPEEDVDILAELFAEDVQQWPEDAWLAIDDYQFAMESAASERFVDQLTLQTPMQMLITSRRRPSWATARRILYGEIFEIDRRDLAMETSEARKVVSCKSADLSQILENARGWPAVIGLLSLRTTARTKKQQVPEQLYDYFAEELYSELSPTERRGLGRLSFVSGFDASLAKLLLGASAKRVLSAGLHTGLVNESRLGGFEIHPLLADFLQERAFPEDADRRTAAAGVGQGLLAVDRWDEAVGLATRFRDPALLLAAFEDALRSLINQGRISTVMRWLASADALHCQSPLLDLAEAEVAFRLGEHGKAETLATQALRRFPNGHHLEARAHICAGQGASLASRELESIEHFERAQRTATSTRERREALYGLYCALSELEKPEASQVLGELRKLEVDTADDQLRRVAVVLIDAVRNGGVQAALSEVDAHLGVLTKASDPLITTSILHSLSTARSLSAEYDEAVDAARELLRVAERIRFDFARPFAHFDLAVAFIGQRAFSQANREIDRVIATMPAGGDLHLDANLRVVRCRLLLVTGRPSEAAASCSPDLLSSEPTAPLHAEMLINRAAALASEGRAAEALQSADQAEAISSRSLATRVLVPAVRSICASDRSEREGLAAKSWHAAVESGNFDSLVTAYRGYPAFLESLRPSAGTQLGRLLLRVRDSSLARKNGIPVDREMRRGTATLTSREVEVLELIATGLSNKEVAQVLFIVESTVKVHLRHVYEKLSVRGRTEAVAAWVKRP